MRSSMLAACAAAVLGATLAAPALAITGDWTEDHEHPFVGLMVFYDASGEFIGRCSGSLITPTKFLTAGHCTEEVDGVVSARVYFQQDAGAHYDPVTQVDPVSGYPQTCAPGTLGVWCATADEFHHFGFADFDGFPNTRDLTLVILDQPISVAEYAELPDPGDLDGLDTARGRKNTVITVSGYGLSYRVEEHSALTNLSLRERLMATSTLVNLVSANNDGYNVQTQGNGKDLGGTCSGDSGGPIFLGGTASSKIVAITSFGLNEHCRGVDFGYRLDRTEVLEWINAH